MGEGEGEGMRLSHIPKYQVFTLEHFLCLLGTYNECPGQSNKTQEHTPAPEAECSVISDSCVAVLARTQLTCIRYLLSVSADSNVKSLEAWTYALLLSDADQTFSAEKAGLVLLSVSWSVDFVFRSFVFAVRSRCQYIAFRLLHRVSGGANGQHEVNILDQEFT